ncbi:hypothetical protein ACMXYW_14950 [Neptuniibacter sp. QD48_55]|uniref:hypothetical protein n=1 Tax=Neptuniibacter sp. QD48_55 TaxID=3398212 RepID=UPI0039F4FADA
MPKKPQANNDENDIVGSNFTIHFCEGAEESFLEALSHLTTAKQSTITARMFALLERKANGQLSGDSDKKEGILPDKSHFRAIKKIPLRCYYWQSKVRKATIFVSHFKYKDQQNLDPRDTRRVVKNWWAYEKSTDS